MSPTSYQAAPPRVSWRREHSHRARRVKEIWRLRFLPLKSRKSSLMSRPQYGRRAAPRRKKVNASPTGLAAALDAPSVFAPGSGGAGRGALRARFFGMKWLRGSSMKWALVALGLLTTSCAGVIGAGAALVVVGAGVLSMACYDRMAVTVTDGLTGTKLCDAKVTFTEDGSVTEATSCYTAD